jgi:aromatic-L-amino-acid decarboxylase
MSPAEFRAHGHAVVDWIADYLQNIRDYPVFPNVKPGEITDALPASGPEIGEPMEKILEDFKSIIVPGMTHWNHPRFYAYFSVTASGPGILGEMLTAALNVNHMLWQTSPAATELEQVTLSWLRQWMGLPEEFFGVIYDTASTSSMQAIVTAKDFAVPECRLSGEHPPLTLYTSEHSHSSIDRGAITAGIGYHNVRHVPVDGEFRMIPKELERMIEEDKRAGKKPFCVVATIGTTSTTSFDPLREIAEIARRHGIWLHLDAAYAGPASLLEEYKHVFDGAELADSIVINPHKWLFTPIDLSILYTRHPEILKRAFSLKPPAYLQSTEDTRAVNLAEYGVALGRRFRSLKLWFVLRYFGREGIAEVVRRHIQLAHELAGMIRENPHFELAAPVPFSLVCFRYRGSDDDNRQLLAAVNRTGQAYLSPTELNGRFVLRLVVSNMATTSSDVHDTWSLIQSLVSSRISAS